MECLVEGGRDIKLYWNYTSMCLLLAIVQDLNKVVNQNRVTDVSPMLCVNETLMRCKDTDNDL